jgi:opacity protein-like surface antigen
MRLATTLAVAAVLGAVAALPAAAQTTDRFALGGQIGTTGVGVEGQFAASRQVTLRATADAFQYDDAEFETDNVNYDGELELNQGGLFVDLHPAGSPLFVSAGAYFGDRGADLRATAIGPVQIGGQTFTAAEVGTLEGEVDLGDFAPFVGAGFNNTFTTGGRVGFKALIGAAFGGDPEVELRRVGGATLPATVQAQLEAELANEERELESDAEDYNIYPVLQVGLAFRF